MALDIIIGVVVGAALVGAYLGTRDVLLSAFQSLSPLDDCKTCGWPRSFGRRCLCDLGLESPDLRRERLSRASQGESDG